MGRVVGRTGTQDQAGAAAVTLSDVTVRFGRFEAVRGVNFSIPSKRITALIGPSGCGKTTLLRSINRMHDEVRGASVTGSIRLGDFEVYGPNTEVTLLRARVGMIFQRPTPFPTLSIYDNVVAGLRFNGVKKKALLDEAAESALVSSALWDSVKTRLKGSATSLSGGQQQRLCIARALAVEPDVLLMDEPTGSLDPVSTRHIEEVVKQLSSRVTVVIVTHNLQQAGRISDYCGLMLTEDSGPGELIESGSTQALFAQAADARTQGYIEGKFG
ncbi:MAG: phosphate ABC transporter ATP-binding protein [Candidatus Dormiibacterota bacterium]